MTRLDVIKQILKYNKGKRYLEIGVDGGDVLGPVPAEVKVGVDPYPRLGDLEEWANKHNSSLYVMKSDEFFEKNEDTYDVVFVDGLHLYEQAIKDILNAFNCLNPNGFVIVHDLHPTQDVEAARERKTLAWCGDVWKVAIDIDRNHPDIHFFTVDSDAGVGVMWRENNDTPLEVGYHEEYIHLPFAIFEKYQDTVMRFIEPDPAVVAEHLPELN